MSEILFLAHRVPFPPNRGDKIRSAHLLKKLASVAPVHVGCFAETEADRDGAKDVADISASYCVVNRSKPLVLAGVQAVLAGKPVSLIAFYSTHLANWVRETIAENPISTIVVFSGQMGQYIPMDFDGCVVVDLCDVDSAKFDAYAQAGERVWLNSREGRLLAREEERLAQRANPTILISKSEAELLRSRLQCPAQTRLEVMGNGIDADFFDPAKVEPHTHIASRRGPHFIFTGQMDYPPNEQAAIWAIESLLPVIQATHPAAEMHIVGRAPRPALTNRGDRAGVTIWGEVADMRPFLAAADCAVVPLSLARGVQNKVLEAMAMQLPVLLTPDASIGIDASDGEHWMLCDAAPQLMAQKVDALLADVDRGKRMGRSARQFVLEHHDWDAMLAQLDDWISIGCEGTRNAA